MEFMRLFFESLKKLKNSGGFANLEIIHHGFDILHIQDLMGFQIERVECAIKKHIPEFGYEFVFYGMKFLKRDGYSLFHFSPSGWFMALIICIIVFMSIKKCTFGMFFYWYIWLTI